MSKFCAYIITIESRDERVFDANNLATSLETGNIFDEVSLHPAIYWQDKAAIVDYLTRFPQHTFKESYLEDCRIGQLAVALSHISAWRRLLASDHDAAVVFEDDIYVTDMPRFDEIMSHLRSDGAIEWTRLHLHKRFRDRIVETGRGSTLIDDPQPWGFAAYYITRSGAEKMLRYCHNMEKPIDWYPPILARNKVLDGKTVTEVIVDHHAFEGDDAELQGRHGIERRADTLQKTASAIYTSPPLADDAELRRFVSRLNNINDLRRHGATVLRGIFDKEAIEHARKRVLDHRHLFRNTRPTASSGHLAGFHRFPGLEPLHNLLTGNSRIRELIDFAAGGESVCSIGLTDITINRSQQWHVDLLRGKFQDFLEPSVIWGHDGGGVYKVILYLNDTNSLEVVRGSHLRPISLESDDHAEPDADAEVSSIAVHAGDVVVMDLRCCHRGADEAAYASGQWDDNPRILVSTVLGGAERKLTKAMEVGNFFRLMDWWGRMPQAVSLPQRRARPL